MSARHVRSGLRTKATTRMIPMKRKMKGMKKTKGPMSRCVAWWVGGWW
jgi:hypothetical protein